MDFMPGTRRAAAAAKNHIRQIVTAAVTAVGLLGGLAIAAGPAQASTAPTVIYGMPTGSGFGGAGSNFVHGQVKPTGTLLFTADGSGWFTIKSWYNWSGSSAEASATLHVRSCWESCFRYATEPASLHFYDVQTHDGHRYFTRMHFDLNYTVAGTSSSTLVFSSHGIPAWYYYFG
jgi:hypothetical protein